MTQLYWMDEAKGAEEADDTVAFVRDDFAPTKFRSGPENISKVNQKGTSSEREPLCLIPVACCSYGVNSSVVVTNPCHIH
eukprot:gene11161-3346_t